uniref:cartilage intermediate layer protein 2-like n=1 Tax=Styela clava TaxID=7725 RepID=UPI00193A1135|nr:cartilage intermediate layer protein 2-like [Styela clava]
MLQTTCNRCQTVQWDPYYLGGDHVDISPTKGLVCENKKQKDHKCNDYKVRFCCHFKEPSCKGKWTQWFDRDNPSGKGDYETLSDLITESEGGSKYYICHKPIGIDARALNPHRPWQAVYEKVHISADKGLYCVNKEQSDRRCEDYKVRLCCPPKRKYVPYRPPLNQVHHINASKLFE